MSDLTLASTNDLLDELIRRNEAAVLVTAHFQDASEKNARIQLRYGAVARKMTPEQAEALLVRALYMFDEEDIEWRTETE